MKSFCFPSWLTPGISFITSSPSYIVENRTPLQANHKYKFCYAFGSKISLKLYIKKKSALINRPHRFAPDVLLKILHRFIPSCLEASGIVSGSPVLRQQHTELEFTLQECFIILSTVSTHKKVKESYDKTRHTSSKTKSETKVKSYWQLKKKLEINLIVCRKDNGKTKSEGNGVTICLYFSFVCSLQATYVSQIA